MSKRIYEDLEKEIASIKGAGLYKEERIIFSPQADKIKVQRGEVINLCANNYLGLANDKRLIEASKKGLDTHGYGLSSVRFICGTQDIHKILEKKLSQFLHTEDTILYSSCFDANGGLFEPLLGKEDVIISDRLNHASIIDGIRLCKAELRVYTHADMKELENILKETQNFRYRMIATDGVFSMDGDIAKLDEIVELSEKYDAIVMVDDSHATGFFGKTGRGSIEYKGVLGKIDIITSTLGKAMGGASGGFTSGRRILVEYLRQRSRPYLFSNTLAPAIVSAAIQAVDLLQESTELVEKLHNNTMFFRKAMTGKGFNIKPGEHPIIPIMLGEARLAHEMADRLLDKGIYVIGFSYPVVPKGEARIRVQISAAHTEDELKYAVEMFSAVGKELNII